jgi:FkbM family methyltransferase
LQLKQVDRYWLPEILDGPARYLKGYAEIEPQILPYCEHRSVVQAGGHIGIFPAGLSARFKNVYTFEPGAENFACLVRNAPQRNVFPMRAMVGDSRTPRALRMGERNTGGHSVGGLGDTPMLRIDDMGLTDCDALILDLEGYEFFALLGAMETIGRTHPLIAVEENKKSRGQGFDAGAIKTLLGAHGYKLRDKHPGENLIFTVPK